MQFDTQDDESLPPDPVTLAQYLFIYWQQGLHFHEHIEETESNTFAQETINELSILVYEYSPYTELEEATKEQM